jgi:hypothetical protein
VKKKKASQLLALTLSLNWHGGHVTLACFDGVEEYLVCLHWKRLPKSYGGGFVPTYGGESAGYQGPICWG